MTAQGGSSSWWEGDDWWCDDDAGWAEGWTEGWAEGGQGWQAWSGWDGWQDGATQFGSLGGILDDASQTLEAGERLLKRGQVQGALRSFDRARLFLEPYLEHLRGPHANDPAIRRLRSLFLKILLKVAACHLRGEPPRLRPEPARALALSEEALALEPAFGEAAFQRSEALRALGRQEEAEEALAKAAKMDPKFQGGQDADSLPPRQLLVQAKRTCEQGSLHFRRGDLAAARSSYDEAMGLLWRHEKLWDGKAGEGGVAQQLSATAVALLSNIAQCLLRGEPPESEKALAYCEEALRLDPTGIKALFRKGKALLNMQDYAGAYATFSRAAELDPKDAGIRKELEKAKGMDDYLRKLWTHQQSGAAEGSSEEEEPAREPAQAGQQEPPAAPQTQPNRGGIRRVLRRRAPPAPAQPQPPAREGSDSDDDLPSLGGDDDPPTLGGEDAAGPEPEAPAGEASPAPGGAEVPLEALQEEAQRLREQGGELFRRGQVQKAVRCYEKSIELLGPHELRWRGILKESDAAKQLCQTALLLLTNLAQCFLQGEPPELPPEPERALECCQEALELDAKSTKALFRKGRALVALGRHAEAEVALAKAAKLDPKQAEIRSELEKVRELTQPSSWPDAELPTPMGTIGPHAVTDLADELTAELVEQGMAGYSKRMLFTIWLEVERHFGAGSGRQLARLVPLVQRLARGEAHRSCEAGKGQRNVFSYIEGLLPEQPWHDPAGHPWCATLAGGTGALLSELRAEEQRAEHAGKPLWEPPDDGVGGSVSLVIYLVQAGVWVAGERFPKSRSILGSLTGLRPFEVLLTRSPPRSKGPLHISDSNCVLSAHLALDLQEGSSNTLRVGESTREWRTGQVFVFDHTYQHSARNKSARDRVTLACRFYHSGISEVERYTLIFLAQLMETLRWSSKWRLASLLTTGTAGLAGRPASHGAGGRLALEA